MKHLLLAALLPLAACGLPGEGPSTRAIERNAARTDGTAGFALIEIDQRVATALQADAVATERAMPTATLPPVRPIGRIGPGDLLKITIWDTGTGSNTNNVDRPPSDVGVRVEPSGYVSLPFAGRIRAAGQTPSAVEAELVGALSKLTVSPAASVLVVDDTTNAVIVQGEIGRPGRQTLSPGSNTLLDVIALSGGPRIPADQVLVRVERGDVQVTHPLSRIAAQPELNVRLGPGDRVALLPLNRRFYAFGAVNRPGEQVFPSETQTLGQALARISGLQDNRADPTGLYVFRSQPEALTRQLTTTPSDNPTRAVYHLRMDDPNAFFLATTFRVRPEDTIFVSNSPVADISKVISLITGLGSLAATPRNFTGGAF